MTLKQTYNKQLKSKLAKEFSIKNSMAIPHVEKIVINMGTKDALRDKGAKGRIIEELASISGQAPQTRPAKISEAGFSIRKGDLVGLKVTLRGDRMYDFLQRLISIVLPRLRDFRGVPAKSFDAHGNYSLGIAENTIFPEIDLAKVDKPRGLEVTIVTSTDNKKQSRRLLELLGIPFEKEEHGKN